MRGNVLLAVLTLLVAVCLVVPALLAGLSSGRAAGRPLRGAAGPVTPPATESHNVRRIVPVVPASPPERQAPSGARRAPYDGAAEDPPAAVPGPRS